jgi:hypothetical protein
MIHSTMMAIMGRMSCPHRQGNDLAAGHGREGRPFPQRRVAAVGSDLSSHIPSPIHGVTRIEGIGGVENKA